MKIVYCIPATYNSGGMERVLSVKANYLADTYGYDVTIITTSQRGRSNFYPFSPKVNFIDLGIDYEEIMTFPIRKRIIARIKAKKVHRRLLSEILHKIKPDVTVSMFTHEMTFLPQIHDGSRKVLELHFSKHFRALDAKSNGVSLVFRAINRVLDFFDRKAIKYYDKFVVLSHRDASDWGNNYPNICVISNPSTFIPNIEDCANISVKRALAVGRLCQQKGFDILIEAWKLLPKTLKSQWTLDIVGSGPDKERLSEEINRLGLNARISILPPTRDIASLFKNHSLFCFPSRYEGFGLSLMEAMSFGLPAVAADCPCGPSELITDKENGRLVQPENPIAFSNAIASLMTAPELRQQLGQRANRSIINRFSVEIIMKQWHELFTTLMHNQ